VNLEEIEARWKDATPGPWVASHKDVTQESVGIMTADSRGRVVGGYVAHVYDGSMDDAIAIASAPTDIAYLLNRVRNSDGELARMQRLFDGLLAACQLKDARASGLETELDRYKRAHEWFVENANGANQDNSRCHWCEAWRGPQSEPHKWGCEWVKAKELWV